MALNTANKGTAPPEPPEDTSVPLFYNYHEFSVQNYSLLARSTSSLTTRTAPEDEDIHEIPLIITHFPNVYVPVNTLLYETTRIVRIPRVFDKEPYPQFSNVLPGREPGSITNGMDLEPEFTAVGSFEGQFFGTSSLSPLSGMVEESDFRNLIDDVNKILKESYGFNWLHVLEFILDMLTLWFLSEWFKLSDKRNLDRLETLIEKQNEILQPKNVKIISPRRSAYLSLDFQIPKPELPSNHTMYSNEEKDAGSK